MFVTASPTMQCIYSRVSKASLPKTGVLLNSAGDFREFSPKKFKNGAAGDFRQKSPPLAGLSATKEGTSLKRGLAGWGGRIRTSVWWNQNPLPYHLATPQSCLESGGTGSPTDSFWPRRSIEGVEAFS